MLEPANIYYCVGKVRISFLNSFPPFSFTMLFLSSIVIYQEKNPIIRCMFAPYRTIQKVLRRGSTGWRVLPELVPIQSKHCSVTAILVLYGLPRLVVGSIIAHEAMHAWLKLNQISGLDLQVEEGICQLMALIWVERQQPKVRICKK